MVSDHMLRQSGHLPGTYVAYRPNVSHHSVSDDHVVKAFPKASSECHLCHNWCRQYDEKPEKVESIVRGGDRAGYAIRQEQFKTSRLSKTALFSIYKRVLSARRLGAEATDIDYKTAKDHSKNYQKVSYSERLLSDILTRLACSANGG